MPILNKLDMDFPVPDYRFDQKNETFKRAHWDNTFETVSREHYEGVEYKQKPGWTKSDFAVRNAGWNVEWEFGMGNSRSNSGLYSWDSISPKAEAFIKSGGKVKESPSKMSSLVKGAARNLGADLVGIAKVNPNWIYSHEYNLIDQEHSRMELPDKCTNAIVLAVEMNYDSMRSSSMVLQGTATSVGYSKMAFLANLVASFIKGLGYKAIPSGNDTALSIPLALSAGLGEYSRMGLLVTKKFGPRVRLCKVFTDLPLEPDSYSPFGVVEFCRTCKACAINCPSQAISYDGMTLEGPNISSHSGALKWYINAEKCYTHWRRRRIDCTHCIRICPFNKKSGKLHEISRFIIKKTSLFNNSFVWMDKAFGYTKKYSPEKFWKY